MVKVIELTQGQIAVVDDADWPLVSTFTYHAHFAKQNQQFYARRWILGTNKRRLLHHDILNVPPGTFVDHKNMNTLDCTRSNLRIATRTQNGFNRNKPSNNTSGYKGVYWDKDHCLWRASIGITIDGKRKRINIGRFANKEDAAKAYADKADEIAGEFARHDFMEEGLVINSI